MAKLSNSQINAYGFYGFATSVGIAVPTSYLTIFMTENLLYSAALMGTTLLVARTIDFIVGLISGGIIQKANMKWGKYRSWLILLRFVVYAGCVIQFIDTSAFSTVPKMIITIIGYCMLHNSMNFIATSQYGILSVMAGSDMEDRSRLAIRGAQAMAAAMIISSAATLPFIQFLTPYVGGSNAYTIVAALFGTLFIVGNMALCKTAAPYDMQQPKDAVSAMPSVKIKDLVESVSTNKQLLVYISASSLQFIGAMSMMGIAAYYYMYVLGNFLLMSLAMTITTAFGLVSSIIGPKIGTKLGKKKAMIVGLLISTVGSLCITLFARTSLVVYIIFSCINSIAMYIYSGFGPNYVLDAGEYGYYKTGKDYRAMATGLFSMPIKIGFALGGAVSSYGLAFIGYQTGMTVTPEFVNSFMWIFGGTPALFYIAAALLMQFGYTITDEDAAKYAAANAEKLAQAAGHQN
ncbi:putative symporter YjmB [Oxobacter pfennigii]|uniref:Putative symporter YjmB n=1 Tax=Oxobacter pfennigii TaxID=36849 RepID=A0A0P8W6P3_9CLOT|nr:MFS transporter [Oxobacter pfennigii]KPU44381.1 putative symporter YjmB [Oxobacter pfennigii]